MATLDLGELNGFPIDDPTPVKRDGKTFVVVRQRETPDDPCVFSDRCPHLGLSLTRGPGGKKYVDGHIVCPFHNSEFDVRTGENLDWTPGFAGRRAPGWSRGLISLGRKPAPLRRFAVEVRDGRLVVDDAPQPPP